MPHPDLNPTFTPGAERAQYAPPRNRLDSEMGIVDATTLILLQKMMADSYEHGRVVWRENKARCTITGEVESNKLPCGPNPAQQKVQAWLVEAGLLEPEEDEESETDDDSQDISPPQSPSISQTSLRRPWHRRLEIVKGSPKSASEPALQSPRSPLSPVKLWSAVQRGTSAIPTIRLKPKDIPALPPSPSPLPPQRKKCLSLGSAPVAGPSKPPSADPGDTLLATAFKRAAMLGTITYDDAEDIMRRHRNPLPRHLSQPNPSWYIPAHTPPPSPPTPPAPATPKRTPRPQFADPTSYRWPEPEPVPPTPPSASPLAEDEDEVLPARGELGCPDLRWYHPLICLLFIYFCVISFSAYVVLRLALKPLLCLAVLYYAIFFFEVLFSLY
ncbi:hypothetical protein C8R44DRAFT_885187 [Mycena epipterygia]|nr:hypothetical protein C8R44DRAFT_885187 [Mycena epipterygia]